MAVKKSDAENVNEVKSLDPWKQKVTIFVPRATDGEPNYKIVGVNGKMFKIMRGKNVQVPIPVAEVLQHSFEAAEEAIRFIEKASN